MGQQLRRLELQADQAARGMPLPKGGTALLAAMEAAEAAVGALEALRPSPEPPPAGSPPAASEGSSPSPGPPASGPGGASALPPGGPASTPPGAGMGGGGPSAPAPGLALVGSPSPEPLPGALGPASTDPTPPGPVAVVAEHQAPSAAPPGRGASPPPPSGTAPSPRPRPPGAVGTQPLGRSGGPQPPGSGHLRPSPAPPPSRGGAEGWVGSSPLGQAPAGQGTAPLRAPEVQPLAFAEAWRLGEALHEAQALRFQLLALAMRAAALPGPGRSWVEATQRAQQAVVAEALPMPQAAWGPRLAQALVESPAMVRQCHALQVQWEAWLALHLKAGEVHRQELRLGPAAASPWHKSFPLEAYRAGLYALGRLHDTVRGQALLEAFWPVPGA